MSMTGPQKADVIFPAGKRVPADGGTGGKRCGKKAMRPESSPQANTVVLEEKFAGVQAGADRYGGDYETEWEFLRAVLMKNGVPEKVILQENRATYTYENAIFFPPGSG